MEQHETEAALLPNIANQMRSLLSNLYLAASQVIPPEQREQDPALDAKAAILVDTAHGEVLFHCQAGKHPTTFRHHGNALAHDLGGVESNQFITLIADAATAGPRRAAQGHQ